jgi:UDP-glucose 4-epimerase
MTFTARTGVPTLALRPVAVWGPEKYVLAQTERGADPRSEGLPYWEYGAFVDVRDVAAAVEQALAVQLRGHRRALLCAADISASAPTLEMVARLAPSVPVRLRERYTADPWRALFDCSAAEAVLAWRPRYGGRERRSERLPRTTRNRLPDRQWGRA